MFRRANNPDYRKVRARAPTRPISAISLTRFSQLARTEGIPIATKLACQIHGPLFSFNHLLGRPAIQPRNADTIPTWVDVE